MSIRYGGRFFPRIDWVEVSDDANPTDPPKTIGRFDPLAISTDGPRGDDAKAGENPGSRYGLTEDEYASIAGTAIYGDGLTNPRPDGKFVVSGRVIVREETKGG